jgi:hypothetical protein
MGNAMAAKRTSLRLDEDLMKSLKQYALDNDMTMTDAIDRAVRNLVAMGSSSSDEKPFKMLVYHGKGGMHPGIDPTSNASMLDAIDEDEYEWYRAHTKTKDDRAAG